MFVNMQSKEETRYKKEGPTHTAPVHSTVSGHLQRKATNEKSVKRVQPVVGHLRYDDKAVEKTNQQSLQLQRQNDIRKQRDELLQRKRQNRLSFEDMITEVERESKNLVRSKRKPSRSSENLRKQQLLHSVGRGNDTKWTEIQNANLTTGKEKKLTIKPFTIRRRHDSDNKVGEVKTETLIQSKDIHVEADKRKEKTASLSPNTEKELHNVQKSSLSEIIVQHNRFSQDKNTQDTYTSKKTSQIEEVKKPLVIRIGPKSKVKKPDTGHEFDDDFLDYCMSKHYKLRHSHWKNKDKVLKRLRRKYMSLRKLITKDPEVVLERLKVACDSPTNVGKSINDDKVDEDETDDASRRSPEADLVDPRVISMSRTLQSGHNGKIGMEKIFKQAKDKRSACSNRTGHKATGSSTQKYSIKPDWSNIKEKLKQICSKKSKDDKSKNTPNTNKNRPVDSLKMNMNHDIRESQFSETSTSLATKLGFDDDNRGTELQYDGYSIEICYDDFDDEVSTVTETVSEDYEAESNNENKADHLLHITSDAIPNLCVKEDISPESSRNSPMSPPVLEREVDSFFNPSNIKVTVKAEPTDLAIEPSSDNTFRSAERHFDAENVSFEESKDPKPPEVPWLVITDICSLNPSVQQSDKRVAPVEQAEDCSQVKSQGNDHKTNSSTMDIGYSGTENISDTDRLNSTEDHNPENETVSGLESPVSKTVTEQHSYNTDTVSDEREIVVGEDKAEVRTKDADATSEGNSRISETNDTEYDLIDEKNMTGENNDNALGNNTWPSESEIGSIRQQTVKEQDIKDICHSSDTRVSNIFETFGAQCTNSCNEKEKETEKNTDLVHPGDKRSELDDGIDEDKEESLELCETEKNENKEAESTDVDELNVIKTNESNHDECYSSNNLIAIENELGNAAVNSASTNVIPESSVSTDEVSEDITELEADTSDGPADQCVESARHLDVLDVDASTNLLGESGSNIDDYINDDDDENKDNITIAEQLSDDAYELAKDDLALAKEEEVLNVTIKTADEQIDDVKDNLESDMHQNSGGLVAVEQTALSGDDDKTLSENTHDSSLSNKTDDTEKSVCSKWKIKFNISDGSKIRGEGKNNRRRKSLTDKQRGNEEDSDDVCRHVPARRKQRQTSRTTDPTGASTEERLMCDFPKHNWLFNKYSNLAACSSSSSSSCSNKSGSSSSNTNSSSGSSINSSNNSNNNNNRSSNINRSSSSINNNSSSISSSINSSSGSCISKVAKSEEQLTSVMNNLEVDRKSENIPEKNNTTTPPAPACLQDGGLSLISYTLSTCTKSQAVTITPVSTCGSEQTTSMMSQQLTGSSVDHESNSVVDFTMSGAEQCHDVCKSMARSEDTTSLKVSQTVVDQMISTISEDDCDLESDFATCASGENVTITPQALPAEVTGTEDAKVEAVQNDVIKSADLSEVMVQIAEETFSSKITEPLEQGTNENEEDSCEDEIIDLSREKTSSPAVHREVAECRREAVQGVDGSTTASKTEIASVRQRPTQRVQPQVYRKPSQTDHHIPGPGVPSNQGLQPAHTLHKKQTLDGSTKHCIPIQPVLVTGDKDQSCSTPTDTRPGQLSDFKSSHQATDVLLIPVQPLIQTETTGKFEETHPAGFQPGSLIHVQTQPVSSFYPTSRQLMPIVLNPTHVSNAYSSDPKTILPAPAICEQSYDNLRLDSELTSYQERNSQGSLVTQPLPGCPQSLPPPPLLIQVHPQAIRSDQTSVSLSTSSISSVAVSKSNLIQAEISHMQDLPPVISGKTPVHISQVVGSPAVHTSSLSSITEADPSLDKLAEAVPNLTIRFSEGKSYNGVNRNEGVKEDGAYSNNLSDPADRDTRKADTGSEFKESEGGVSSSTVKSVKNSSEDNEEVDDEIKKEMEELEKEIRRREQEQAEMLRKKTELLNKMKAKSSKVKVLSSQHDDTIKAEDDGQKVDALTDDAKEDVFDEKKELSEPKQINEETSVDDGYFDGVDVVDQDEDDDSDDDNNLVIDLSSVQKDSNENDDVKDDTAKSRSEHDLQKIEELIEDNPEVLNNNSATAPEVVEESSINQSVIVDCDEIGTLDLSTKRKLPENLHNPNTSSGSTSESSTISTNVTPASSSITDIPQNMTKSSNSMGQPEVWSKNFEASTVITSSMASQSLMALCSSELVGNKNNPQNDRDQTLPEGDKDDVGAVSLVCSKESTTVETSSESNIRSSDIISTAMEVACSQSVDEGHESITEAVTNAISDQSHIAEIPATAGMTCVTAGTNVTTSVSYTTTNMSKGPICSAEASESSCPIPTRPRTRLVEILPAHCNPPPAKIPRGEPAHQQPGSIKNMLRKMRRREIYLPHHVETSNPFRPRKRPFFSGPLEDDCAHGMAKRITPGTPEIAHNTRPFGIPGRLIVPLKKTLHKRMMHSDPPLSASQDSSTKQGQPLIKSPGPFLATSVPIASRSCNSVLDSYSHPMLTSPAGLSNPPQNHGSQYSKRQRSRSDSSRHPTSAEPPLNRSLSGEPCIIDLTADVPRGRDRPNKQTGHRSLDSERAIQLELSAALAKRSRMDFLKQGNAMMNEQDLTPHGRPINSENNFGPSGHPVASYSQMKPSEDLGRILDMAQNVHTFSLQQNQERVDKQRASMAGMGAGSDGGRWPTRIQGEGQGPTDYTRHGMREPDRGNQMYSGPGPENMSLRKRVLRTDSREEPSGRSPPVMQQYSRPPHSAPSNQIQELLLQPHPTAQREPMRPPLPGEQNNQLKMAPPTASRQSGGPVFDPSRATTAEEQIRLQKMQMVREHYLRKQQSLQQGNKMLGSQGHHPVSPNEGPAHHDGRLGMDGRYLGPGSQNDQGPRANVQDKQYSQRLGRNFRNGMIEVDPSAVRPNSAGRSQGMLRQRGPVGVSSGQYTSMEQMSRRGPGSAYTAEPIPSQAESPAYNMAMASRGSLPVPLQGQTSQSPTDIRSQGSQGQNVPNNAGEGYFHDNRNSLMMDQLNYPSVSQHHGPSPADFHQSHSMGNFPGPQNLVRAPHNMGSQMSPQMMPQQYMPRNPMHRPGMPMSQMPTPLMSPGNGEPPGRFRVPASPTTGIPRRVETEPDVQTVPNATADSIPIHQQHIVNQQESPRMEGNTADIPQPPVTSIHSIQPSHIPSSQLHQQSPHLLPQTSHLHPQTSHLHPISPQLHPQLSQLHPQLSHHHPISPQHQPQSPQLHLQTSHHHPISPQHQPQAQPLHPLSAQEHLQSQQHHQQSQQHHQQSQKLHPQSQQHHVQSQQHHPQSQQHHPQSQQHHPQSQQHHPQSQQHHPQSQQHHPQSQQSQQHHPQSQQHHQQSQQHHPQSQQHHPRSQQHHTQSRQHHAQSHLQGQQTHQFNNILSTQRQQTKATISQDCISDLHQDMSNHTMQHRRYGNQTTNEHPSNVQANVQTMIEMQTNALKRTQNIGVDSSKEVRKQSVPAAPRPRGRPRRLHMIGPPKHLGKVNQENGTHNNMGAYQQPANSRHGQHMTAVANNQPVKASAQQADESRVQRLTEERSRSQGGGEEMPHLQQIQGSCVICGKFSLYLCSSCKQIWYCSQQCQLTHWQTHAAECAGGPGRPTS